MKAIIMTVNLESGGSISHRDPNSLEFRGFVLRSARFF